MAMSVAAASRFRYSHSVGLLLHQGRGFHNPVDIALGRYGVIYVVNRSNSMQAPGSLRISMCTVDERYVGAFGAFGEGEGEFIWPTSAAVDSRGRVYVSDEHRHDVQVFEHDGAYLGKWGGFGSDVGQLDRPSGLAIDADDTVYVVDHLNSRVQKLSTAGEPMDVWGSAGSDEGQFNLPWGLTIGPDGNVYVADWGNDRVQMLTPDGRFLASFGTPGAGEGQLTRPAGVGVDRGGNVYVADWGNERVQVFGGDGRPLAILVGDSTVSTWGEEFLATRDDLWDGRAIAADFEIEKRFWGPTNVKIDAEGNVLVVDSCRHRIQIYRPNAPANGADQA